MAVCKEATEKDIDDYINAEINSNDVVLFSKTYCPFCRKVKTILQDKGVQVHSIELDTMGTVGQSVQARLKLLTNQATVPNLFIRSRHIGGCSVVEDLAACGALDEILYGNTDPQQYDFDIVVIGGGSGGLAAAKEAARNGKTVCVCDFVNKSPQGTTWGLGGTCTNVGCVPKKLMHRAATIRRDIEDATTYGWTLDPSSVTHNWPELVKSVQSHIKSLNWKNRKDLAALGVTYLNGLASFEDNHTLKVEMAEGGTKTITAQSIIISVGCRPKLLDIPGVEACVTSDDIFTLEKIPQKILIVGASYVGLEVASFLQTLGSRVYIMVRSSILRGNDFDREVVGRLQVEMEREGIVFLMGFTPVHISGASPSIRVEAVLEDESKVTGMYDTIMLAVGRNPETERLNLDKAGVKLCTNGKIPTTSWDQTNVVNIFAIGDCADCRPELTPTAVLAGKLLGKRLSQVECPGPIDYTTVPKTVFTSPEYGACGESEESAIEAFGAERVNVFHALYRPLERILTQPMFRAFAKLITVPDGQNKDRVVGVHFLGPHAGEVMQGFALAVKLKATKQDLDGLVGIHPTCAQVITMLVPRLHDVPVENQDSAC